MFNAAARFDSAETQAICESVGEQTATPPLFHDQGSGTRVNGKENEKILLCC